LVVFECFGVQLYIVTKLNNVEFDTHYYLYKSSILYNYKFYVSYVLLIFLTWDEMFLVVKPEGLEYLILITKISLAQRKPEKY
jgi:hypothetical protein